MGICFMTHGTQTGALWQSKRVAWEGEVMEFHEGGDLNVLMADSCWCMTKPENSVKQLSFN